MKSNSIIQVKWVFSKIRHLDYLEVRSWLVGVLCSQQQMAIIICVPRSTLALKEQGREILPFLESLREHMGLAWELTCLIYETIQ